MEVILLERVAKLGQMGEVVRVKDGFARNFLLKRGKALRATTDNRARFEGMKADLEARNLQAKGEATKVAEKIDGRNVVILRQASESGQLFGSVSIRDIIASFEADKVTISRSQVMLDAPIKTIGKHKIAIAVHPEVEVGVSVTVARSADEAERINRGEDISTRQEDQDAAAEALAAAGEFFDPEARRDDVEPAESDAACREVRRRFPLATNRSSPACSGRARCFQTHHWEIGGTGGPAGATGGGDAATGAGVAAGAGPPPCGSEAALDAVDAGEPLGLPPGAGSAGLASPSGDFGAGVTAGTGSARSGTSDFAPSPLGESSLADSDFCLIRLCFRFAAFILGCTWLFVLGYLALCSLAHRRVGLAARLGSSSPGLPRLLRRCLADSLRPSGPRSSAAAAGVCPSPAGLAASGLASRLRPGRASGSVGGTRPSPSGLAAS